MKISTAKNLLKIYLENKKPCLLVGQPGIGKTDIVKQACQEMGIDLVISHPVVSDPTDYKGLPFVVNGQAEFLPFADLVKLIDAKKPLVCFFDDLGQAANSVQAAIMQLLLAREINGKKISDHVVFCAATNRKQDQAGVSGLLEPVKSRFYAIIEIDLDLTDFINYGIENNFDSSLLAFAKFKPEYLDFIPSKEIKPSICPRVFEFINNALNFPNITIDQDLIESIAGREFALEFISFRQILSSLPNLQEILTGKQVKFDFEPSIIYTVIIALIKKLDHSNVENCFKWIENLHIEFQSLFVSLALNNKPDVLTVSKSYTSWLVKNQAVNNF